MVTDGLSALSDTVTGLLTQFSGQQDPSPTPPTRTTTPPDSTNAAGDPPSSNPSHAGDPSDATGLPDGRVIVLERCVSWSTGLSAVIRIVDPVAIRHGGILAGRQIARLARPYAVDNMEALAITRERSGTMLWIASDDNFMLLQRTLLLKFRVID